jgi:hypothetical protein
MYLILCVSNVLLRYLRRFYFFNVIFLSPLEVRYLILFFALLLFINIIVFVTEINPLSIQVGDVCRVSGSIFSSSSRYFLEFFGLELCFFRAY